MAGCEESVLSVTMLTLMETPVKVSALSELYSSSLWELWELSAWGAVRGAVTRGSNEGQ